MRIADTTTRRRALVAALVFLVACGSDGDDGSPSATLEGTWRTEPIAPADAKQVLRDGGLEEWVDEFEARTPFEGDTVLVLEIGDEWDLYGESADGKRSEIDFDASYDVDGDEVVVSHSAGSNTFRWEIDGDTLTLEHVDSTMPTFEGVPEEVFQRALYMTSAFARTA